jgi:electron transport complex protein RnfG
MVMPERARALLVVLSFAAISALLVTGSYELSRDRIRENQRRQLVSTLHAVFPPELHDNDLSAARIEIVDRDLLGSATPLDAFVATRSGHLTGVVMTVVAPDGYNGAITLLLGVRADGIVTGVRVLDHRETPGLGDAIESERSPWIRQFEGRSLDEPAAEQWKVVREGGAFDALTGATITSRAVIQALRNALSYFERQRDDFVAYAARQADDATGRE